jgi:uncharacterized repeat protein (TIGR03837 family)
MTATRRLPLPMPPTAARWDIFCKVVDNFGDAGVCWRLARLLAREHGLAVTLWIDDPNALRRMAPGVDPARERQHLAGVTLRRWAQPFPILASSEVPDVVVEGFGCGLPESYVSALAARTTPPAWFILEYLSAEPWVDAAHGRPSPHPMLGLPRRFWFPGFTRSSGGLLRERGLFDLRRRFALDPAAQAALWSLLGVPPRREGEIRVSMFCYPASPLAALQDAWARSAVPVVCLIPESSVGDTAMDSALPPAAPLSRGAVTVHRIPFVAQDHYDRLLWACDLNFVRGEDSFVRAQWAARPLVWQIYPQAEAAHRVKLAAFVDRYGTVMAAPAAAALRGLFAAWNEAPEAASLDAAWHQVAAVLPELTAAAGRWSERLQDLPELATGLVTAARAGV